MDADADRPVEGRGGPRQRPGVDLHGLRQAGALLRAASAAPGGESRSGEGDRDQKDRD